MNLIELYTDNIYKTHPRPWRVEPDHVSFTYQDYLCEIYRSESTMILCGYVAVTDSHILYQQDIEEMTDIRVYGGIAWCGFGDGIKLLTHDNKGNRLWWFGFDCAHAGDLIPSMFEKQSTQSVESYRKSVGETYKNIPFVRNQLHNLVQDIMDYELNSSIL